MAMAVISTGTLVTLLIPPLVPLGSVLIPYPLPRLIDSAATRVNSRAPFNVRDQEDAPWTMTTFPAAATMC